MINLQFSLQRNGFIQRLRDQDIFYHNVLLTEQENSVDLQVTYAADQRMVLSNFHVKDHFKFFETSQCLCSFAALSPKSA